jgi:glycosyltransferase involved in cell wall biosynthesis
VVGATPGLSEPAKSVHDLVMKYRSSARVPEHVAHQPVPTALMEAMSCGCAVVSTANCMIPSIIENGVNGFISNDPAELRAYCRRLLTDVDLAASMGAAARQTIIDRFSQEKFVANWDSLLREAAGFTYTGE